MDFSTESPTSDDLARLARSTRYRRRVRRLILALGGLMVVSAGFAATFHRFLFLGNVGEVDPGRLYRSAQPHANLPELVRTYRLGSILNLRGGSEKDNWYSAEVDVSQSLGVDLYDFPMSAVRRPRRRDLLTILEVFDRCSYPLLVHCKSGSDRTGLAVALYLMSQRGVPPDEAKRAFSLEHGHVPLLGPERLHEPFDEYAQWLTERRLSHTPARLRDWVEHEYRSDEPREDPPRPIAPGPRARFTTARKN